MTGAQRDCEGQEKKKLQAQLLKLHRARRLVSTPRGLVVSDLEV